MRSEILSKDLEQKYEDFILNQDKTLLYASIKYRNLLREFLACKDTYLVALSGNDIKGVMPLFIKENEKYGNVLNSLPFYGSNGAVIAENNDIQTKRFLLEEYQEMLKAKDFIAGTIITSPFETDHLFYDKELNYQYKEQRIGQITMFPDSADRLLSSFDQMPRRAIRKGQKSNVTVSWENGLDYIDFLFLTHKENMTKIGITYKPKSFFKSITNKFEYDKDYRIYVAFINKTPVAALLVFYFNKTVEYYTPATVEKYREFQATSVVIYAAMEDALNNGYKRWNWGGASQTQKGVYDFKRRWGSSNFHYHYYSTIKTDELNILDKETLLTEFPYFYVLPFNALGTN